MVVVVVGAIGMPDHQPVRAATLAGDEVDLARGRTTPPGCARSAARRSRSAARAPAVHELPLVFGDLMRPGRDLDRPGPDSGVADPFGDLLYIDGGDLLDRQVAEGCA